MTGPSHSSLESQLDALGVLVTQARAAALYDALGRVQTASVTDMSRRSAVNSRNTIATMKEVCDLLRRYAEANAAKVDDPAVTAAWLRRLAEHLDPSAAA